MKVQEFCREVEQKIPIRTYFMWDVFNFFKRPQLVHVKFVDPSVIIPIYSFLESLFFLYMSSS
jgi:hypothetical protein